MKEIFLTLKIKTETNDILFVELTESGLVEDSYGAGSIYNFHLEKMEVLMSQIIEKLPEIINKKIIKEKKK